MASKAYWRNVILRSRWASSDLVQQCILGIADMAGMSTCLRFAHHSPFPCEPGLPGREQDVSNQPQIINLFLQLRRDLHLTMLFISHDLRPLRPYTHDAAVTRVAFLFLLIGN